MSGPRHRELEWRGGSHREHPTIHEPEPTGSLHRFPGTVVRKDEGGSLNQ
jgi:hypothetical protein